VPFTSLDRARLSGHAGVPPPCCHVHDIYDVNIAIAIEVIGGIIVCIAHPAAPSAGYLHNVRHVHIAVAVIVAEKDTKFDRGIQQQLDFSNPTSEPGCYQGPSSLIVAVVKSQLKSRFPLRVAYPDQTKVFWGE